MRDRHRGVLGCAPLGTPVRGPPTKQGSSKLGDEFFIGNLPDKNAHTQAMKQRIDRTEGRALYGRRLATVEPVFANLRHNKRLNRFTLRGTAKVNGQWKLFALVHNIEKLAHHGYAQ